MSKRHRLTDLGYASYQDYLQSPHWRSVKVRLLIKKPLCCVCENNRADTLHHLTYTRIGTENDNDILLLCQNCHNIIHAELDRRYSDRTMEYKARRTGLVIRGICSGRITQKKKPRRNIKVKRPNAYQSSSILPKEQKILDELKQEHRILLARVKKNRIVKIHSPNWQRPAVAASTLALAGQTIALHGRVRSVVNHKTATADRRRRG